jgi:hypothetical protein
MKKIALAFTCLWLAAGNVALADATADFNALL